MLTKLKQHGKEKKRTLKTRTQNLKAAKQTIKKKATTKKGRLKASDENDLKDFLVDELKDIYFAEHEILKGLTKMKDGATSEKLKKAIDLHYKQTETQIVRLEEAFSLLDEKPAKKKCESIIGILKEG